MSSNEYALLAARIEYARNDGRLSLTTVMRLANLGFDVPALESRFEEETN